MISRLKKIAVIAGLAAVIGAALLYRLGELPLADPDEPRYAESAREMIELGSVMVPYFNYEPRLQKPVLHYWLICASYGLLGVSEFSARLPSVLAALALVLMTFMVAKLFLDTGAAALACLIMGSSPLFFVPARLTMPDMVFSTFIIASLYCFYLGWQAPAGCGAKNRWYAGFYFFQIAAAWTKGPVGIIVPVAVALLSLWRQRDLRELRQLHLWRGLAVVLAGSLPWYAYIYFFVDQQTMGMLTQRETVGRIFGWYGRTHDPLYYFFLVLSAGLLPWIFLAPWALYQRFRKLEPSRLLSFLETWFLFVLVFFSLCATKKPQYVVMLCGVFALWLAAVFTAAARGFASRRNTGLIISLFAFLAVAIVGSFKGISWISKHQPELMVGGMVAGCALIIPSLAALWLAGRGHARSALTALSLVMLLSLMTTVSYGTAWIEKYRSMRAFLQENEAVIARAAEAYTGVKVFNGLPFYLRRQVVINTDAEFLVQKLQSPLPCIVFTSDRRYKRNKELFGKYLTAERYRKVLLSNFVAPE